MTLESCPREPEVVAAVASGRAGQGWLAHPAGAAGLDAAHASDGVARPTGSEDDAELRAHVAQCEVCRDVLLVSSFLQEGATEERAADESAEAAQARQTDGRRVPGGALVWWRAALQSRVDSERRASRPLTWAYGLAAASLAGLAASWLGFLWPALERTREFVSDFAAETEEVAARLTDFLAPLMVRLSDVSVAVWSVAFVVLLLLILGPLAVYAALRDER